MKPDETERLLSEDVTHPIKGFHSRRLYSLDALRGFDMFWITGAEDIFHGLAKSTGSPPLHFARPVVFKNSRSGRIDFNDPCDLYRALRDIRRKTVEEQCLKTKQENIKVVQCGRCFHNPGAGMEPGFSY